MPVLLGGGQQVGLATQTTATGPTGQGRGRAGAGLGVPLAGAAQNDLKPWPGPRPPPDPRPRAHSPVQSRPVSQPAGAAGPLGMPPQASQVKWEPG